jgi:general secretion pathway protein E
VDRALRVAKESQEYLGDVLNKLGLISELDLVGIYAKISNIPVIKKEDFPKETLEIMGVEGCFLKTSSILPLSVTESEIKVATSNPLDDFARQAIEFATNIPTQYFIASASDIAVTYDEWEKFSANKLTDMEWGDDTEDFDDLDKLKDLASEAPVIRYVNRLMHMAVSKKASDIHVEPMEACLKIRMRFDGILENIEDPPHRFKSAIISRIKIMAGLDIAERRLPQDGRIRMAIQGKDIDFRISTTPTAFGESVVMRVLNQHDMELDLKTLGFPARELTQFHKAIEKPNGIILVTGPTGSGKTTTLYAALNILNNTSSKILTIEDPIEYMLEGVNQVQVNGQIGLTFASALRSFLRQDPDIMMVGEIRDIETAQIAVQASLTGHLILSTLHTNSAAGAIARLLDMGVENFLLSSTVRLVMGQRLIRKLCPSCRVQNNITGYYKRAGCEDCGHTGFKGRTMIVEVLQVTEAIQKLIMERASELEIEKMAVSEGMVTMEKQADEMVLVGITSKEEIQRVIGEELL